MGNCCGTPEPLSTNPPNRPVDQASGGSPRAPEDLTPEGLARALGRPSAASHPSFPPQQPCVVDFIERSSEVVDSLDETIHLQQCRWCSDHFEHMSHDGRLTNIVFGNPKIPDYKAASYVWGATRPLQMHCRQCGKQFSIPMRDKQKFNDLMSLSSDSEWMWIDAISIDQTDQVDVADKVARMGHIYENAKYVSVLLPSEDEEAARELFSLAHTATFINMNHAEFSRNLQTLQEQRLPRACKNFYEIITRFSRNMHRYHYWRRAWTFQEWAMAADLELGCEDRRIPGIVRGLKTVVLQAATMMAIYKTLQGQFAKIELGFSRGQVIQRLDEVKRLFPSERAFNAPDAAATGSEDTDFQVLMAHLGFGRTLGLRCSQPGALFDPERNLLGLFRLDMPLTQAPENALRERLNMTLSALSVTQREASYPADLVASWASMCKIAYQYDKHDTFVEALAKVLHVLRHEKGIRIYNFQANSSSSADGLDQDFLKYATRHTQCNSIGQSTDFLGIPIFTGRADTATHMLISLKQEKYVSLPGEPCRRIRKLRRSRLVGCDNLYDPSGAHLTHFAGTVLGEYDNFSLTDVVGNVADIISRVSPDIIERKILVRAQVVFHSPHIPQELQGMEHWVTMWAICNRIFQSEELFVAREETNGQLVLMKQTPVSKVPRIEAYLVLTDQQSGTHLMRCDARGIVDIALNVPKRADIINAALPKDRVLQGFIGLESEVLLATG